MRKFKKSLLSLLLLLCGAVCAADSGGVTEGTQIFAGKKVYLDRQIVDSTLTGHVTLNKNTSQVLRMNPNSTPRNVTLPDVAVCKGYEYFIINSASDATSLTVKNADASTIVTIAQTEAAYIFSDGITWYGFAFSNAAAGYMVATGATTGATSQTQVFTNGVTLDAIAGQTAATTFAFTGKVGSSAAGQVVEIIAGAGNGAFTGGSMLVKGGAGGAGGAGGPATLQGGTPASGNGAGGAIAVTGGAGSGSGAGGANVQLGGAGGATGAGGNWLATAGRGGSTSGAAGTAGLIAGAGGASSTVSGGVATLQAGASGSGATGNGGDVAITGGAGVATTSNGGSIVLTPGVANGSAIAGGNFLRSATGMNFKQQVAPGAGADQAEVLTAAAMINGIFVHTVSTGRTLTTPTGAQITAGCPVSVTTGDSFEFTVITIGSGGDDISTLTAGDGNVTFIGDVTVGPVSTTTRSSGTWIFRKTGASTWVGYRKN